MLRYSTLFVLLVSALLPPAVHTQPADTTKHLRPALHTSFLFYPETLWTPSAGFGLGLGVRFENLGLQRSMLRIRGTMAQRRHSLLVTWFSNEPYEASAYAMVSFFFESTQRFGFRGVGPASSHNHSLWVDKEIMDAELRFVVSPFGRHFRIQPSIRLLQHTAQGYQNDSDGAFEALDRASQRNLLAALGDPGSGFPQADHVQTGIDLGLAFAYDTRDRQKRPSRGFLAQASLRNYRALHDLPLRYDTYAGSLYGFIPMPARRHVLALRALGVVTDRRNILPVPFYMMPRLDARIVPGLGFNRFFSEDFLVLDAAYRFPLYEVMNLFALEAAFSLGAASAYDNLLKQFKPALSLAADFDTGLDHYPLRPVSAISLSLLPLYMDDVYLSVSFGFSADGFSALSFRFVDDLRRIHPRIR